jgi:AcrR family transcriptional regulator
MDPAPGKRKVRKQHRREAILAVAERGFLKHGYSGTSMSAISAELGGSKGTLWTYFPSKGELFAAVLEEATSTYRREIADLLKPSEDVRETVLQFCRSYICKITSPEALRLHRLVSAEISRFPELGDIFYRRAPLPVLNMLADFFQKAMNAGSLTGGDPHQAACVLTSLCIGGSHMRMLWGQSASEEEREHEAKLATDVFMSAFAVGTGLGLTSMLNRKPSSSPPTEACPSYTLAAPSAKRKAR